MKYGKYLLTFLFIVFGLSNLSAQYDFMQRTNGDFWAGMGSGMTLSFSAPNRASFYSHARGGRSGTYSIEHEYGIPFLHLNWDDGTFSRYLMLVNEDIIALYADNTEPSWKAGWSYFGNGSTGRAFPIMGSITASSSLRWGNIHFAATAERLGLHINRVWAVEGGVGERLYITLPNQFAGSLFISSGYVHFSRPYLFQANARPKRIRITSARNETEFFEVELCDTPNFQTISFDANGMGEHENIILEILEIYSGTRYNHMAINSILGSFSQ